MCTLEDGGGVAGRDALERGVLEEGVVPEGGLSPEGVPGEGSVPSLPARSPGMLRQGSSWGPAAAAPGRGLERVGRGDGECWGNDDGDAGEVKPDIQ